MNIEKIKKSKTTEELLEFGIINIDKPSGPTSFNVSEQVKRILNVKKTSHFGTLDPKVTGVLPIALNRACKLTGFFLGENKTYVGIMRFHEEISKEKVENVIKEKFLGTISQLPPVKSRVARKVREREIISFKILEQDERQKAEPLATSPEARPSVVGLKLGQSKDFLFEVECQGGTYIRKLIHDLGQELGIGAHMLELRRTRAGIFDEKASFNLYDLEKNVNNEKSLKEMISPGEIISELYPVIEIKKEPVDRILHGQPIYEKDLLKKVNAEKDEKICVFSEEKFIGVFKVLREDKIFAKSEFTMQEIK